MEKRKKLTLLWRNLDSLELGKDVVLVPYYLGQALGYQIEICCGYSDKFAQQVEEKQKEGITFTRLNLGYNPFLRIPVYIKYLLKESSHIDLLMCFHWRLETFINILLYKFLNKKGLVYIKLDTEFGREFDLSRCSFWGKTIRKSLYNKCLKTINALSCETSQSFDFLFHNKDFGTLLKNKLVLMPNAFDEVQFRNTGLTERSFQQKENLMITVGRLGTHQKNTEMLLKSLGDIDLKEWKFYLIGPVEKKINSTIEQFYIDHPEKKGQVLFTGKIDNKKDLWDWYNKAKVFVSTSRWESYGLVLIEAKRLRNYMVCTRVGAAEDLLEQEKYGSFVMQEDYNGLKDILTQIIDKEINIDVYQNYDSQKLSYQKAVDKLVVLLAKRNYT